MITIQLSQIEFDLLQDAFEDLKKCLSREIGQIRPHQDLTGQSQIMSKKLKDYIRLYANLKIQHYEKRKQNAETPNVCANCQNIPCVNNLPKTKISNDPHGNKGLS